MLATIEEVSGKSFDYIIAGGGTAGLVVAARLTEDSSVSVLVLEAGPGNLDDPAILTPAGFGSHFGNPKYDWSYKTVPQPSCGGRSVVWNRGKMLGGSSAINFFEYHRPAMSDINAWEKLGNKGWNWDLLKKYFIKHEQFIPPKQDTELISPDLKEHGSNGPLKVSYPLVNCNLEKPFFEAQEKLGINRVKEPFSGNTKGSWLTPVTIDPVTIQRTYAANAYYQPNASRKNFIVMTDTHVAKVNLSKSGNGEMTATGISFLHDGKLHEVKANKEVILSSGTIGNPQILELSGIGDPSVLRTAGVDVAIDLPGVGSNIQEHTYLGLLHKIRKDVEDNYLTFDCLSKPEELAKNLELLKEGKGVFGTSISCMTFVPLAAISPDAETIQKQLKDSMQNDFQSGKLSAALKKQYEVQLQHIQHKEPSCELICAQGFFSCGSPTPDAKHVSLTVCINHPFSRGTIHINSSDPLEHPAIDPHYFEHDYDTQNAVEIVKFCRRLVEEEPFKSILTDETQPGPEKQTDQELAEWYKQNFFTTYHTVGSCSMLPREDAGVVDTKLKVYGTTNLRVVDISIVPLHIGAHMQATAYAIGELGADIIKGKLNL
ncbi:alcohol oxidase [Stereum hirsutum FP-91666 SS1]|uniref:alcohol oxidase n=1 Tax=Stereum hirsutum (strain FP-91666) TaxID=721885 RepID=UPI000440CE5C|nr:alcohol oxidase [Stereum hirsutum FP-91666 SS1]EIM88744.1 alcohol oxidase [Stereum hirsutum FP-91666 SS1]